MSIRALADAWRLNVTPAQKLLMLALADHANDEDFECWPSLNHLADKTGLSRASVKRLLSELEAEGFIARHQRQHRSTVYRLNVDDWGGLTMSLGSPRAQGRLTVSPPVGSPRAQGRLTVSPRIFIEPSIEPSKEPEEGRASERASKNTTPRLDISQRPEEISEQDARDWVDMRRKIRKPPTQRAFNGVMGKVVAAAEACGITTAEVIQMAIESGWQGVEVDWIKNKMAQHVRARGVRPAVDNSGAVQEAIELFEREQAELRARGEVYEAY